MLEAKDERLMVEPGGEEGDLLCGHADELGEVANGELDGMAEPTTFVVGVPS